MKILVVDDQESNRKLISFFSKRLGHDAITANNGAEAVAICRNQLPDLVLMDIMMPVMDGIQASKEIRKLCGDHWLPIIFLSARSTEADQLEVLETGDDFLPKPVNLQLLEAKIKVMGRIAEMQQHIIEHAKILADYQRETEREQKFAGEMLEKITRYKENSSGLVQRWIKPALHFSGDVIVHALTPECNLNFLIADSTGHGLSAAICTLPVVDTFFNMTERGCAINEIAREINNKLNFLLPTGRFVAAALISVEENQVQIWNGGIPFAVFMTKAGSIIKEWPSMYPPLGMLSDTSFDARMDTWHWPEAGQIVICSDGIIEAENNAGEFFGEDRLRAALQGSGGNNSFGAVIAASEQHLGSLENRDDLSLATIFLGSPTLT